MPAPKNTGKTNYDKGVMGSKGTTSAPTKVKTIMGDQYISQAYKAPITKKNKKKFVVEIKEDTPVETVILPSFPSFPDSPSNSTTSIKLPEKDNVLSLTSNNVDEATIVAMVFEKLGAVELTKFTRTDTVEGINPYYNIISNLSAIKKEFDPSNLVASQKSDTSLYNAFSIKLSNKIPGDQYLADRGLDNYIYVDTNGDLIIELDNITPDELVEVEIDTNGTIVEVR